MPMVRWCLKGEVPACMIPTESMYCQVLLEV